MIATTTAGCRYDADLGVMIKSSRRFTHLFVAAVTAFALTCARADEPVAHANDKFIIDPSSTTIFLNKATLTVAPLSRRQGVFSGSYEVNVSPVSMTSERGNLSVGFPDDALRRLARKTQVSFHGDATNSDGKHRTIDGRSTPTDADHGEIVLKIISERGKLVFHTTYHFERS